MKKIVLLVVTLCLLSGCQKEKEEEKIIYDYEDFSGIKIEWNNLFLPAKSQYFAYIYSKSCGHCENIKQDVLSYIKTNLESFYLIEYSKEIPLTKNAFLTIGKEKIEEVAILGTPSLIEISGGYIALNIAGEKDIITYLGNLPYNGCIKEIEQQ